MDNPCGRAAGVTRGRGPLNCWVPHLCQWQVGSGLRLGFCNNSQPAVLLGRRTGVVACGRCCLKCQWGQFGFFAVWVVLVSGGLLLAYGLRWTANCLRVPYPTLQGKSSVLANMDGAAFVYRREHVETRLTDWASANKVNNVLGSSPPRRPKAAVVFCARRCSLRWREDRVG
jgi:hypothetical protein